MADDKFLTPAQTAALCQCSVGSLYNWRNKRGFPEPVGTNYSMAAVLRWCRENGVQVAKTQGV